MAKQTILWTVLPNGRVSDGDLAGRLQVSIVVSPRLTPEAANEQRLGAFGEFLDWPGTLSEARFKLRIGTQGAGLRPLNRPDSALWQKLFDENTPVAGFEFKDMSRANLRSYSVRNVMGFLRRSYGRLAVQAATTHPTLLPWSNAHPGLKNMIEDLGTRTETMDFGHRQIEVAQPGFSRFLGDYEKSVEASIDRKVFGRRGVYKGTATAPGAEDGGLPGAGGSFNRRALPADWHDPANGGPDASVMAQFNGADEYTFFQANRFYHRTRPTAAQRAMRRPSFTGIPAPLAAPEYDFHRIIASYADYAQLLRRLGLVIDCVLEDNGPVDSLLAAGGGTATGNVSLEIDWGGTHDASTDQRPATAWEADKTRFLVRPRTPDHERGLLKLVHARDQSGPAADKPRSNFEVYQVDPDGAALKTVGFLLSAQNLVAKSLSLKQADGEVTYTTGRRQPVAALRSGGLGVARHDRASVTATEAATAALKNQMVDSGNGQSVVLFAEDVMRGYRVDVADVPADGIPTRWHTLCAREGEYRLIKAAEELVLPPDEGYVSGASTTRSTDASTNPDDHYLHESIFRWTGWSLCTPLPGRTLRARQVEDSQLQGEESAEVTDEATTGNGVSARFRAAPGSLPRLRFGRSYRLRARFVDLAGNSLEVDDPSLDPLENATDAIDYQRFEPVDPPALVQAAQVSEGESLERMVIRSNFDSSPAEYLSAPEFALAIGEPESGDFEYTPTNVRHIVPPKSSQQQCEQHGLLDPFFSDPNRIKTGYEISARESGSLYDLPGTELITPASLEKIATTSALPPAMPSPENPVGERLSGGQYIVHRPDIGEAPYLPDGAAEGIALRGLDGSELPGVTNATDFGPDGVIELGPGCLLHENADGKRTLLVHFEGKWPERQGLKIVLEERPAKLDDPPCREDYIDDGLPRWDATERMLTLPVAKGRIVRLAYASFVRNDFLRSFGMPGWTNNPSLVEELASLGRHWMITPYRELVLVHATQQPVCLPTLTKLRIHRQDGDQHARLICPLVNLHGPSTGKFEIVADWGEWTDDLQKDGPELVASEGELGEVLLAENHVNKFRLDKAVDAQLAEPDRDLGQENRRARGDRHEFGDTRFRLIRYRVRASTRFREYLPPALFARRENVTRTGPAAEGPAVASGADDDPGAPVLRDNAGNNDRMIVPATLPPDEPRVLYTVPTFRWQQSSSAETTSHTRLGNGLRVWLDRPWFSSGNGELLGVVILGDGSNFNQIPDDMQGLVTQWGVDPLWDSRLPKHKTSVKDFGARVHDEAVQLQEKPDGNRVHVVGHRVHWDIDRKLWYCDIELDPGATYMPFVRLALVRYQPHALPAAKVSKVTLAEFAQVLPKRRALFRQTEDGLTVTLRGQAPHAGPLAAEAPLLGTGRLLPLRLRQSGRNRLELVLQTREPELETDLAWRDHSVLASVSIMPSGGRPALRPLDTPGLDIDVAPAGRRIESRSGARVDLSATADLGRFEPALPTLPVRPDPGRILNLLEPTLYQSDPLTLPGTPQLDRRLVLREFERYYTDRSLREGTSRTVRRRIIEERLVYAVEYPL